MAFFKKQKLRGRYYYALVERKRIKGKIQQKTIKSFGTTPPEYFFPKMRKGDCRDLLLGVPTESIDMILTDAPYFLTTKETKGNWDIFENDKSFLEFTRTWVEQCVRVLKKGGIFLSFFCKFRTSHLFEMLEAKGMKRMNVFVWHKKNGWTPNQTRVFAEKVEMAAIAYKPGKYTFNTNGIESNVFSLGTGAGSKERASQGYHPTQKPLRMIKHLVKLFTNPKEVILDPFGGKGTTAVAAMHCMRKSIVFEQDDYFFEATRRRLDSEVTTCLAKPQDWNIKGLFFD